MDYDFTFSQRQIRRSVMPITDSAIQSLAKIKLFDSDEEKNEKLYELHKYLLQYAMSKNKSREVGILWNIVTNEYVVVKGEANGVNLHTNSKAAKMLRESYDNTLMFIHNHPRNSNFSNVDLQSFCIKDAIVAITAVCNDGRIHALRKENNFNANAVEIEYNEIIKNGNSGLDEIRRNASKFGIMYRCSVPNRKERSV